MKKPPVLFPLLAEPVRWHMVLALAESDWLIQELARRVRQPLNLVSYHLRLLREAGVIHERRSSLDGRATYCSLDLDRLSALYRAAGQALHPAPHPALTALPAASATRPTLRVLFLCTHNAARSQMAEGLFRAAVRGRWLVASAGSHPSGVHPFAVKTMAERGVDIAGQTSKDLESLSVRDYDIVISLCDRVRAEPLTLANRPRRAHWSLPDPLGESRRTQPRAFRETADGLARRICWFLERYGQSHATDPFQESS